MISQKVGVRAHDFGKMPMEKLAAVLTENGFGSAQLALPKALAEVADYDAINEAVIDRVKKAFQGIDIPVFGCYRDISNPDQEKRLAEVKMIQTMIPFAKQLGAAVIGTEAAYAHYNTAEERRAAYPRMLDSIQRITETAAKYEMPFAIEPVYYYPLDTAETTAKVIRAVGDAKHLRVIFDAYNIMTKENMNRQEELFNEWMDAVLPYTDVLHIKDFEYDKGKDEKVEGTLGAGMINYGLIKARLQEAPQNIYLLREGLVLDRAKEELAYMKNIAE